MKVHYKVHNSYLASLERLLLISPNGLERLLQSFKVSRIRDACFTASLFQGFITHNSSPKSRSVTRLHE
mgnify:FL=1